MLISAKVKTKFKEIVRIFLTGGLDPGKASLAVGIGVLWGVFPIIGTTTALCTLSALVLRLNLAIVNLVNYLLYPIQLLMIIPYIKAGESVTGNSHFQDLNKEQFDVFSFGNFSVSPGEVFAVIGHALLGWLLMAPVFASVVYIIFRYILVRKSRKAKHSPKPRFGQ